MDIILPRVRDSEIISPLLHEFLRIFVKRCILRLNARELNDDPISITYYAGAKFWRGAISARDSVSCLVHDISYTAGFAGEPLNNSR